MLVFLLVLPALASCSSLRALAALSRSTDHFIAFPADNRIRIEPGAESLAEQVAPYLPGAIELVEAAHYRPFAAPPTIYICATNSSYHRLTGQRAAATVTDKLFLSPDLFDRQRPLDRYLAHELSHLHLVQKLGIYDSLRLPPWFKEGLAEFVSGGATGASVTASEAYAAINRQESFQPETGRGLLASFFFPHYGSYWHIEHRMFYRQSMLFVQFLHAQDEEAFQDFLIAVESGTKFKKALSDAYPGGLSMLWGNFLEKSRAATDQSHKVDG